MSAEIKKIRQMGKTKIVTIPKNSDLKTGEYVLIQRVDTSGFKEVLGSTA